MGRAALRAGLAVVAAALLWVGVTWWALESGRVAVIETIGAEGATRSTHVWYAEMDGSLWLEAGAPENGWVVDVGRDPRLVFRAEGTARSYRALPSDDRAVHAALRERLRERYGCRDRWVGLWVDAPRSFAVRLEPVGEGG